MDAVNATYATGTLTFPWTLYTIKVHNTLLRGYPLLVTIHKLTKYDP